ncbi:hypothetical protein BGP_3431 [Beggiatoa sp. PS]|nr:hypothetical protein BGP_3431 [Beggiatoa sp. PS]
MPVLFNFPKPIVTCQKNPLRINGNVCETGFNNALVIFDGNLLNGTRQYFFFAFEQKIDQVKMFSSFPHIRGINLTGFKNLSGFRKKKRRTHRFAPPYTILRVYFRYLYRIQDQVDRVV